MSDDDRKPTFSERDRMRREGADRPRGARAEAEDARRTRDTLAMADALFTGEQGGQEGKALADAVREAHGTAALPDACRAYYEAIGAPRSLELASIFLDADDKPLRVAVLDELLRQREDGSLEIAGGLRRQLRLLSEDFDDDLASRAEDLLEPA